MEYVLLSYQYSHFISRWTNYCVNKIYFDIFRQKKSLYLYTIHTLNTFFFYLRHMSLALYKCIVYFCCNKLYNSENNYLPLLYKQKQFLNLFNEWTWTIQNSEYIFLCCFYSGNSISILVLCWCSASMWNLF